MSTMVGGHEGAIPSRKPLASSLCLTFLLPELDLQGLSSQGPQGHFERPEFREPGRGAEQLLQSQPWPVLLMQQVWEPCGNDVPWASLASHPEVFPEQTLPQTEIAAVQ